MEPDSLPLPPQGPFESGELKGRLLVSLPVVRDPNFFRTVVYMVEHSDGGSLGVILNRPSETRLGEILEGWGALAAEPDLVFVGGPVATDSAVCLAQSNPGGPPFAGMEVGQGIGVVNLSDDPSEVEQSVSQLRVFVGHAGWGPGQLEDEIEGQGWYITDPQPGDIFTREPDRLMRDVMRRQPGFTAALANFPADPDLN